MNLRVWRGLGASGGGKAPPACAKEGGDARQETEGLADGGVWPRGAKTCQAATGGMPTEPNGASACRAGTSYAGRNAP